jgi:hypothetical protein
MAAHRTTRELFAEAVSKVLNDASLSKPALRAAGLDPILRRPLGSPGPRSGNAGMKSPVADLAERSRLMDINKFER